MATQRQKRVAKLIIENASIDKPLTGGEIVESSGYGVSMKKNPQVILESDGVKEALNDYGFSEDNAKMVVAEILMNSEVEATARLNAADKVFKVHGTYSPEKTQNVNVVINTLDPKAVEIAKKYEDEIKKSL